MGEPQSILCFPAPPRVMRGRHATNDERGTRHQDAGTCFAAAGACFAALALAGLACLAAGSTDPAPSPSSIIAIRSAFFSFEPGDAPAG